MTVKDAMSTIESAKECSEFLYQLANKEQDEHITDILTKSYELLDEYVDVLEQMKVQKT